MKLILDLDEDVIKNMNGYCKQQNITLEILITNLFNRYVQEPADVIDGIYKRTGSLADLEKFTQLLREYMNEAILDIEESAKSEEAYDADEIMAKVFKVLARDLLDNAYLLTNLYKEYQEGN